MPIALGAPGFEMPLHERVSVLVAAVGGPVKAAALTGRARSHIDNMRKPGARLRLDDLLPLCEAAGVSLDWVATGYMVRPDLAARSVEIGGAGDTTGSDGLGGFVRLLPVRPRQDDAGAEKWEPSDLAVSSAWLTARGKLTAETARYATAADDGMSPLIRKGALLVVDTRPSKPRAGIYLVEAGDDLVARRLSPMPGKRLELTADAIPNWRLAIGEGDPPTILHRIIWAGQDV